jgi:putative hemolysin
MGMAGELVLRSLLGALVIMAANGFFVAVEFALVSVRRRQMEQLAEEGKPGAALMARMLRDPDRAIAGSQVGVTMASILLGVVAEDPLTHLLAPLLNQATGNLPWTAGLSSVLVFLFISFCQMVLGEQTPKTVALRYPVATALFVARPMMIFARIASPLVWLVDQSTDLVLKVMGIRGETGGRGVHSAEELKQVVRESHAEGIIPFAEQAMLMRTLEFGGRFVREAMIPRTDMVAVNKSARLADLLELFHTSLHARFPVYERDLDHISGVVAMKDVLNLLARDPNVVQQPLASLNVIRPVLVVPESRRVGDLFAEMRREHRQMAIVIDEYGGTAGLVTVEELVEEIVGRLTDEWVQESPGVAELGGGVYEIDAQQRVDEVNDALELDLPTSTDYETVAGFLLFLFRHIPKVDEVVTFEGIRFTVLVMDGLKIDRVRAERVHHQPAGDMTSR